MIDGKKAIGVLTSGGDAPGMNAAIRSVVRTAIFRNMKVFGVMRGYNGLIHNEFDELSIRSVSDIIHRGGTVLYTARCPEFKEDKYIQLAADNCRAAGMDGLVVIGGDGSFRGAMDLSAKGFPCVGIPGTIDNDIASSSYTIGFDTAMNTAMEMVDKLRDTAQAHDRCAVVEVMGRRAGHIALNAGIACGATSILVPEKDFDFQKDIIEKIQEAQQTGKKHFIIIVAEGLKYKDNGCTVYELAERIHGATNIESNANVLGHVQRGGSPTVRDRVVASAMGSIAVDLLDRGIGNRVVVMQDDKIIDLDIFEALQMKKGLDDGLYRIADEISK